MHFRFICLAALLVGCGGDPTADAGAADAGGDAGVDDLDAGAGDTIPLRILALNDLHGRLEAPEDGTPGGAAHLARLIGELRSEQENTLLVGAGDMIGGSEPLSGLLHDEPTVAVMNELAFDVVTVGNHEFDRPFAELERLLGGGCHADGCVVGTEWDGSRFPWLGANVVDAETGDGVLPAYEIVEAAGVRIGFIGVTLENTGGIVFAPFVDGLRFEDEAETVNTLVPELLAMDVTVIVVLIHEGGRHPAGPSMCIAPTGAVFPIVDALDDAVDVVVSGHSHFAYVCERGALVTQALAEGQMVTVIDLAIDPTSGAVVRAEASNREVLPDGEEDAAMLALLESYRAVAGPFVDRVVGTVTGDLLSARDPLGQSSAGFVVADAFLEGTASEGAVIALTNGAGVRGDLELARSGPETADGQVRFGELFEMLPFPNAVVTMTLTGAQIERLLEARGGPGVGNPVQPSATLRWAHRAGAPADDRIDPADILVEGAPIDLGASYRVTVNSFIASGPTGYEVLTEGTDVVMGLANTAVVESYLAARSPLAPPALDRVTTR